MQEVLKNGEEAVLVTAIASSGSTPRGAGSRMLVKADGQVCGTIGGGAVEYRAEQTAMEAIKEKTSYVKGFTLTKNQVSDIGMICGGDVVVYFQYITPEDENACDYCAQVLAALERDEDSWIVLDITDVTCWQAGLYDRRNGLTGICRSEGCGGDGWDRDGHGAGYGDRSADDADKDGDGAGGGKGAGERACKDSQVLTLPEEMFGTTARQYEVDERRYYVEPLVRAGRVYVFGGGHVAQELVPVLTHVGFRCVVMDDREAFANPQVFPDAQETVVGDMEKICDYLTIKKEDYVCIMTRGHKADYEVQRQVLACHPRYIGVIGSRNKIGVVTKKLLADGFSLEEIQSCHMPIGTRIYAETPAEIAISIAGEMISVRSGH